MVEIKDKIEEIYNVLIADPFIQSKCEGRVKAYESGELEDKSGTFIIIDPIDVQVPRTYASDISLQTSFIYQINVEGYKRKEVKQVQYRIKELMEQEGLNQLDLGLDDYFSATNRFVDARRYAGNSKLYDTKY